MARLLLIIASALSLLLSWAAADDLRQADPLAPAAYYVKNLTANDVNAGTAIVVASSFVQETGDWYLHMSMPSNRMWVGMGLGPTMAGSVMIIAYKNGTGNGITASVRVATGHHEPEYIGDESVIEYIYNDEYGPNSNVWKKNGILITHVRCRGCVNMTKSAIDYTSEAQPFIYAMGPEETLFSGNPAAALRRHEYYGSFTLNMTAATTYAHFSEGATYGRVPCPNIDTIADVDANIDFKMQNSTTLYNKRDSDPVPVVHAVLMCVAFMGIFPIGSLLLRLTQSVKAHLVTQLIGTVLVLAGLAAAAYASLEYNHTKGFRSGHQLLGLVLVAAVLVQLGLGILNHAIYRRSNKKTIFGKIHLFLGPSVIALAVVNGGLGLDLANRPAGIIPYAVAVAVFSVLFLIARAWAHLYMSHSQYSPDPNALAQFQKAPYHEQVSIPAAYTGEQYTFEQMAAPVSAAPSTPYSVYNPSLRTQDSFMYSPEYEMKEVDVLK